jgi:UDP-N-acetylglucosamine diphosphorylase/glucosamine-1-phosphate N-acetyltransferase
MSKKFCGLILKTAYDKMGETAGVEILGKSMLEWVSLAFSDVEWSVTDYDASVELPTLVKPFIKEDCDYIVVLYSDTPLITKKTVYAAVEEAYTSSRTVIKMTRGYVFNCAYLAGVEKIYTNDTFYFDEEDFITAFNFKQVGLISDVLKNRILDYHMERGVHFEDLAGTVIGCDVVIDKGVTIGFNNVIAGKTTIKSGARIGNGNVLRDCYIDEGAEVESSHAVRSKIGKKTKVGPYANLRENNIVGDGCKIGDFVELKGSVIGDGSKMGHLAYAGNVVMGKNCNVGAGVVFANYDGKDKFTTTVGDNAFIGSSSTIVAPVKIEDGAFIAAGSVINADVPQGALAIARARQCVKPDWTGNKYAPKK